MNKFSVHTSKKKGSLGVDVTICHLLVYIFIFEEKLKVRA